ncbi:hypothetical protein D3C81_1080240 [compost metagenome]
MEQCVTGYRQHCAEEKHQVVQLVHGEYRAAACRADAVTRQQGHEGQRPAAAAGGGADGKFGGHDHAQAAQWPKPGTLLAEQQAQANGIYHPAQQDHAQQSEHQHRVEALQPRQQLAATEQDRHQQCREQCQAHPCQAVHALAWRSSQADLVSGSRP